MIVYCFMCGDLKKIIGETNCFLYFSQTPAKSKSLISHSHIATPVDPEFGRSMAQPSRYQTNRALLKLLHQIANWKCTPGCTINKADLDV